MPYLIQKQRDGSPVKQWDLKGGAITVGRGDDVDAHVDDAEMSRRHFSISPKDNAYVMKDLGSTNGTWVNGKRVSETTLKANDRIRAGKTNFVFTEGLGTIIGKLEKEPKGYSTYISEITKKNKP
jgi:pSer/pThr/pTyr-binding forkhead associated (FHA) protein